MDSTPAEAVANPYLADSYAPVADEHVGVELRVLGELPRDLNGVFAQIASNPKYTPPGRYHWFDGDGMIHAVHFDDGRATYTNRYVRTRALAADEAAGGCSRRGILERPDLRHPDGPYKDTANTDLVFHAGQLLSLWWLSGTPHALRLPDCETLGEQRYGGKLKRAMSAHAKVDPHSGEMVFFDYAPFPPYLTYGVVSASGEIVHHVAIELDGPRSQHDIAFTERYSILFDMSMMFDPDELARGRTKTRFYRDRPSRIGIVPRRGGTGDVRWFEVEPFYMYHTVNAWEDGDTVVLTGCRVANPLVDDPGRPAGNAVETAVGFLAVEPVYYRWHLDLDSGAVREEQLDDVITEFPRMNDIRLGRRSRYSFHPRVARRPTLLFDGLIKYDLEGGATTAHSFPNGWYGGEVSFAPTGDGEDQGYLTTFVTRADGSEAELWVLDARDLASPPLARLPIPFRVPTGFHTRWVSANDISHQRPL